ncbi:MAG TPA: DUF5985 family protein [Nitrospira sp.]|nr:DUF5985 family protein [Nitrospira sp.]
MQTYVNILLGALLMGDLIAGLFFLRYWKITGDRFFLFFATSFFTEAVSRAIADQNIPPFGMESLGYLVRFLQYLLIVLAVVDKNRIGLRAPVPVAPQR